MSAASAVTTVAAALQANLANSSGSTSRPNILWLVSEDNNPLLGAYGDRLAHTPAIDGLARRGVLYRNVYSTAPMCAPSRFAILTGMYAESCGPAHHQRARASLPSMIRGYPEYLRRVGYYCTNNDKTDYNCDLEPQAMWNESSGTAHWRNRPANAPFMSVFNYATTHQSSIFEPTEGMKPADAEALLFWRRNDPPRASKPHVTVADVRVPAYLPDTLGVRHEIALYYEKIEALDRQIGARLAELEADGHADDTIIFYYSDNGGVHPRSKGFCYEEGLRCSLIISFPPKYAHLAPAPAGSTIEPPVSLIDLAPTTLALAGIPQPPTMIGRSLLDRSVGFAKSYAFGMRNRLDERYDMSRTVTDGRYRYIRNYMPNRPWGQYWALGWCSRAYQDWERCWRAGELNPAQARFFGPKPFEELYDLAGDPDQIENLIDRPEQRTNAATLRTVLDKHLLTINDNGFIPEGSPLEGYESSRAHGAYPLKRVMALAEAAARRDPSQFGLFEAGLRDPNEIVRYWSAQGLLMLAEQAKAARATLQRVVHDDESPQVRIVAAEALGGFGDKTAIGVLADMVGHASYPVRLQAINALTYLIPFAAPALPAVERAASEEQPPDFTVRMAARYLSARIRGTYRSSSPIWEWTWYTDRARKAVG